MAVNVYTITSVYRVFFMCSGNMLAYYFQGNDCHIHISPSEYQVNQLTSKGIVHSKTKSHNLLTRRVIPILIDIHLSVELKRRYGECFRSFCHIMKVIRVKNLIIPKDNKGSVT